MQSFYIRLGPAACYTHFSSYPCAECERELKEGSDRLRKLIVDLKSHRDAFHLPLLKVDPTVPKDEIRVVAPGQPPQVYKIRNVQKPVEVQERVSNTECLRFLARVFGLKRTINAGGQRFERDEVNGMAVQCSDQDSYRDVRRVLGAIVASKLSTAENRALVDDRTAKLVQQVKELYREVETLKEKLKGVHEERNQAQVDLAETKRRLEHVKEELKGERIRRMDTGRANAKLAADQLFQANRITKLEMVLRRLVEKLIAVAEPLNGIFAFCYVHGVRWTGPDYAKELDDAKALLGIPRAN